MISIAVAKGDGIGPEIMDAVIEVFTAAEVPLEYSFVDMGKWVFDKGYSIGMTPEAKDKIESLGVLFKGPMETPKGKGVKSINVTARKTWNTYANKRRFKSLKGVNTVFSKAGIPINLTIVRENIEDTYGGIEHFLTPDVALCRKIITRPGSLQVIRYAFEMARQTGSKKVTCGHKANIMKITDGLFLECFKEVAKEYPDIVADDIIVDDLCMKLITRPEMFDVIVLTNLQGDIVSDLCAGMVGGLGFAPSANIGDQISIFEAVHGTAPDISGKGIANPTALLLSGIAMLQHLGLHNKANTIENALLLTLEQGSHTGDFGDRNTPSLSTKEFTTAIIKNLGGVPKENAKGKAQDVPVEPCIEKLFENPFISKNNDTQGESVVGVDFCIRTMDQATEIAEKLGSVCKSKFEISTISNRGTQVWPSGSVFTNLVDSFIVRFESLGLVALSQSEILGLYKDVADNYVVTSLEVLNQFKGERAYSLSQGQAS